MSQGQPTWIGHTLHGRYQIKELLGSGGMATVYKAIDLSLHREVAIKLIHAHLAQQPEFIERFKLEATAVAKLHHPHIVQLYDFHSDHNSSYMVLTYVDGESLNKLLELLNKSNQLLPLSETIRMISTLCDAVAFAHQHDIIHRDLKPSNVLFDKSGHLYLADFGVVRLVGDQGTMTIVGTPHYMSPEQARGDQMLNQRSDIYSLGVMLYEMACGQPPFEGGMHSLILKHLQEPPPDIRLINPDIPAGLAAVIEKALAKDPADRFQSASEMASALRTLGATGGANARSDSTQPLASGAGSSGAPQNKAQNVPSSAPLDHTRNNFIFPIGFLVVAFVVVAGLMLSGVFSSDPPTPTPLIADNPPATSTPKEATTVSTVTVTAEESPRPATQTPLAAPDEPEVAPTITIPARAADLRFGVTDRGMNCPLITEIVALILTQERDLTVDIVEYETADDLFAALALTQQKQIDLTLCFLDPQDRSYIAKHGGYINQIGDTIWEREEKKSLVMVNGTFINPLKTQMPCVDDFFQKLNFAETPFQEQQAQAWLEKHTDAIQLWTTCEQ